MNEVLAQNFVEITGPYSITIHLMEPGGAGFPNVLSSFFNAIIAPEFVMQHDLTMWNQSSSKYSLPYPVLSGSLMDQIKDYFYDEASTCNAGVTPGGCGDTSLAESTSPQLAGTGPYVVQDWNHVTNVVTMTANPNYWGGAWTTKIVPHIQTIYIKNVVDQKTRVLDLQSAASSGQAMTVEVASNYVTDVMDSNAWLNQGKLVSTIPGVTLYGPSTAWDTIWWDFVSNVTSQYTGKFLTFQPFADQRFRLAFADSVNLTELNNDLNLNLIQISSQCDTSWFAAQRSFQRFYQTFLQLQSRSSSQLITRCDDASFDIFQFLQWDCRSFRGVQQYIRLSSFGTCKHMY